MSTALIMLFSFLHNSNTILRLNNWKKFTFYVTLKKIRNALREKVVS